MPRYLLANRSNAMESTLPLLITIKMVIISITVPVDVQNLQHFNVSYTHDGVIHFQTAEII